MCLFIFHFVWVLNSTLQILINYTTQNTIKYNVFTDWPKYNDRGQHVTNKRPTMPSPRFVFHKATTATHLYYGWRNFLWIAPTAPIPLVINKYWMKTWQKMSDSELKPKFIWAKCQRVWRWAMPIRICNYVIIITRKTARCLHCGAIDKANVGYLLKRKSKPPYNYNTNLSRRECLKSIDEYKKKFLFA